VEILAEGRDFYAAPRLSADGRLAYMTWDLPNMPWDSSCVWVDGKVVAGGPEVNAGQPRFSPDGVLHYASDQSGFALLYREDSDQPIVTREADFSGPDWWVGQSTYSWLADGTLVCTWVQDGLDRLGYVRGGELVEIETPFTAFEQVHGQGDRIVCIAGSAAEPTCVARIGLDGAVERLHVSRELPVAPDWISKPRGIAFPTEDGATAHALFYAPVNPQFAAPAGERPPVIVLSHGGPTSRYDAALRLPVQFWTTRGFAVAEVNYRGSTGYGRAYRNALRGRWGIADVQDCVAVVRHLASEGLVDDTRAVIRGGSAGGYTVLQALVSTSAFAAGSCHFGVAELASLVEDTHKLESRYLDSLVGPWPEAADVYRERSPLAHADRLRTPTIVFQGLDDKVVPPAQSEAIVDAMRRHGVPHAYLAFAGEGHGFRRAETIQRVAEAELAFLGRVLGFQPADELPPLAIDNLPAP
jgi:dipeptidyl aminopeptidase/acylaminoacyl peptidase